MRSFNPRPSLMARTVMQNPSIQIWQDKETGHRCWKDSAPGERWYPVPMCDVDRLPEMSPYDYQAWWSESLIIDGVRIGPCYSGLIAKKWSTICRVFHSVAVSLWRFCAWRIRQNKYLKRIRHDNFINIWNAKIAPMRLFGFLFVHYWLTKWFLCAGCFSLKSENITQQRRISPTALISK